MTQGIHSKIEVDPVLDQGLGEDVAWRLFWLYQNLDVLPQPGQIELTFIRTKWTRPSATWDHDHCAGCFATLTDIEMEGVQIVGWMTHVHGKREEWLCEECYRILQDVICGRLKVTYRLIEKHPKNPPKEQS